MLCYIYLGWSADEALHFVHIDAEFLNKFTDLISQFELVLVLLLEQLHENEPVLSLLFIRHDVFELFLHALGILRSIGQCALVFGVALLACVLLHGVHPLFHLDSQIIEDNLVHYYINMHPFN